MREVSELLWNYYRITMNYYGQPYEWNGLRLDSASTAHNIVFAIHNANTQSKWWATCIWFCKAVGMLTLANELNSAILVKRLLHTTRVRIPRVLWRGLNITPWRVWSQRKGTFWQSRPVQDDFPTLYPAECSTEHQNNEDDKHENSLWKKRF